MQARGQLRLTWRLYAESPQSGEISPSDGTGGITVGDLSTQSIMGAFSICPIPTCSPARDDGVGGQHTVISEGDEPHPRHFDRSEAEWRNLPLRWYGQHYGGRSLDSEYHQSIFHLPHTNTHPPLEMTVLASSIQSFQKGTNDKKRCPPSPSFRPKRSGVEKSPPLMVRAALRREIFRLKREGS